MAKVHKTVLVTHSVERMRALVEDVPAYPDFLPWCGGAVIRKQSEGVMEAAICIRFKGIEQEFATRNTRRPDGHIDMVLVDGPFKALSGQWRFTPLGELGAKVELVLDYEFSSKLLEKIIGPVFSWITDTFVDCFVARANALYPDAD
jgi:ribosome-associated toxin RatA of RatAB toxin-antitoxin module